VKPAVVNGVVAVAGQDHGAEVLHLPLQPLGFGDRRIELAIHRLDWKSMLVRSSSGCGRGFGLTAILHRLQRFVVAVGAAGQLGAALVLMRIEPCGSHAAAFAAGPRRSRARRSRRSSP